MKPSLRTFLFAAMLLAGGTVVFAQTYPLPSNTPETPVLCGAGCSDPNLKTVGYKAPINTFTGRFLDSTATSEWFMPFRTARANFVLVMPGIDRIYFRYGNGSVAAYKLSTFFSRLEAKEQLVFPVRPMPANRSNQPELFLNWDAWFNPELSTWKTFNIDGATRMTGFDVDDKGYVYVASTIFGWGVVKDDLGTGGGGKMNSMFQKFPGDGDPKPGKIAAVKGATRYYAYLSASTRNLWDVTDHGNPVQLSATAPLFTAFAKNSTSDRIAIVDGSTSRLSIYAGDALASGSGPLFSDSGNTQFVTSDGTNFYALQNTTTGKSITVIVPSGTTGYMVQGSYSIGSSMNATAMHYGDGYLVVAGESGSWDLRLFKVGSNLVPTLITINASPTPADPNTSGFFRNYYGSAAPGYTTPAYINMSDGTVYKAANGKLYLVVCAAGLGDVYELAAGDTISATNNGRSGRNNPNTPAASNSKTFYGDPVQFIARSSSPNVASVVWNFGNPEAGSALNSQQITGKDQPIVYQYSSIAKTALGTRNVIASNISDPSIKGGTTVTLESPAARFAIAGLATKYLFTQPNASSAAPVVVGDSFVDASDGTIESHYASWTLDSSITNASPDVPLSVGTCGAHTLNFSAFYGPYDAPGTTKGTNFQVPVGAVTYAVRPFAAALELFSSDATSLTFRSVSRIGDQAMINAAQGLTYTWDVVTSANAVILTSGALSTPANFVVPKQTLAGQQNLRVRLTLKTVGNLVGACAGYESSAALSNPLNAPDPKITQSGDCQGTPCTFTATSMAGIDTTADNWRYTWAVSGTPSGMIPPTTVLTNQTLNATFLKQGSFTVSVTATNAYGQTAASVPITISVVANPCATLTASSFVPTWYGKSSGCSPFSACTSGETITFFANAPALGGYDPACGVHTYTWTFPDGTTATTNDASIDRVVTSGGTVKVNVNNGTANRDYTVPQALSFGSVTPPPPPPSQCQTMGPSNMFLSVSGASCPSGGTCTTGDLLSFQAQPYLYNIGCAQHNFSWNFGDGGTSTQQNPVHAYTANGPHTVTMTVSNPYQTYTKTATVTTTAGSSNGGSCPTMTTSNVAISFQAASGCAPGGTACKNGETITFDVVSYAGYDFSCSAHNYNWNFGDGGTASGKTPTHTFSASGPHAVTVTVSNTTQQNFVRALTMQTTDGTGSGNCGPITPNVTLSVTYANAASTCNQLGGDCATGEVVTFNVISYLYDLGCATHTFDWDFGDGSPHLSGQSVTHQYAAQGNYSVKCLVSNGGPTVPLTAAISIKGGSQVRPQITVSYATAPLQGVANGYLFTPSFDRPELVAKWQWDFGDGQKSSMITGTPRAISWIYADSRAYTVTLTAYDASGQPIGVATHPGELKRRSVRH